MYTTHKQFWTLVILMYLTTVSPSVVVREIPSDKAAKVGDLETVLKCTVSTMGPHLVTWTRDGLPLSSNKKVAEERTDKYSIRDSYDLVVKNVKLNDAGRYACNQNLPDTKYIGIAELNVYDEIVCLDNVIHKKENDTIFLTCSTNFAGGDKYTPEFAWEINEKPIASVTQVESQIGVTKNVSSGTSLVAMSDMNGSILTCKYEIVTESGDVMMKDQCRYSIAVQYEARKPSILIDSDDVTDLEISHDLNKHLTLTCSSNGNPAPNYTWTYKPLPRNGNQEIERVEKASDSGVLVLGNVTRNNSGIYTCEAFNIHNRGIVRSEVTLMIRDPCE
ncbi:unnamed protein product [Owenia fusiformis]|uniref:Ig-like domain-containing protein n=1 Tax=Owenia fusiformis TaxID=6347 RepID=A0A8S4Q5M5_OWEFU|nr:unnamed protein product [Owenia fusiformis]